MSDELLLDRRVDEIGVSFLFFRRDFISDDKSSFPTPLINCTHYTEYVFDILQRFARDPAGIMELHANIWAVYTHAWYIEQREIASCRAWSIRVAWNFVTMERGVLSSRQWRIFRCFVCRLRETPLAIESILHSSLHNSGIVARAKEYSTLCVNFSQKVE